MRVCVISDAPSLEDWQVSCLEHLREVPGVAVAERILPAARLHEPDGRRALAEADVALCVGAVAPAQAAVFAPRLGVWSFHFGAWKEANPTAEPLLGQDGVATAALVRLSADPERAVLLRAGFLRPQPRASATLRALRERCARWPAQVCIDIRNGAAALPPDAPEVILDRRAGGTPAFRPWRALRDLAGALVARTDRTLVHEHWSIGVVRRPIADFLDPAMQPRIEWLPVESDRAFAADPFGVQRDGRRVVLYERYDRRSGRGGIASIELDAAGVAQDMPVALGPEIHRSYPYVFEHAGEIFAIPETSAAREVVLYRAVDFPRTWCKAATLLADVDAVDSTVFRHQGRWWLACSSAAERDRCADLFLWHAEAPEGPWQPHVNNPVKTDVRSARPGGTPFVHSGVLYRPAQDCSRTYGGRVVINRVLYLTPAAFREVPVAIVAPDPRGPFPDGLHTLSALGDVTLVDGKRRAIVRAELRRALQSQAAHMRRRSSQPGSAGESEGAW